MGSISFPHSIDSEILLVDYVRAAGHYVVREVTRLEKHTVNLGGCMYVCLEAMIIIALSLFKTSTDG